MVIVQDDKTPMYETMYSMACVYAHSSKLINSQVENKEGIGFISPSALCQTFSIELFLKFYLVIDYPEIYCKDDFLKHEVNIRGHAYCALWDAIEVKYRKKVVSHFRGLHGEVVDEQKFREILLLELGDDPFVKWRYIHEEKGVNFLNIPLFAKVNDALGFSAQEIMNEKTKLGKS